MDIVSDLREEWNAELEFMLMQIHDWTDEIFDVSFLKSCLKII
jgi:hypothetical protein